MITEVLARLRDHHACDDDVPHELMRTPKMQELLRAYRRSTLETEGSTGSRRHRKESVVAAVPESHRLPAAVARYLCQYDRAHLYKQVWSASMPQVAKHYGVTPGEIEKACRHLHIPNPAARLLD